MEARDRAVRAKTGEVGPRPNRPGRADHPKKLGRHRAGVGGSEGP